MSIPFQPEDSRGQLQQSYADFVQAIRQLRSRLADDYAERAGALLRREIAGKHSQIASLREQSEITARELDLAQAKLDMSDSKLNATGRDFCQIWCD